MVRITQLTESILVGWPDVHGHTITFHQALVSIVTAEFISYFPIFLFSYFPIFLFSYGNQIDVNRHGQNQRNLTDGLKNGRLREAPGPKDHCGSDKS